MSQASDFDMPDLYTHLSIYTHMVLIISLDIIKVSGGQQQINKKGKN